jgi:Flp pilus assembly protein TadG
MVQCTLARDADRGAAAVEMAILMPLLVSLVFGIVDFARMFNAEIQLSQASREGVRLAALLKADGTAAYGFDQISTRVSQAAPAPGFSNLTPAVVASVQACPNTQASPPVAMVRVTYAFDGIFWDRNLSEQAVMRCVG